MSDNDNGEKPQRGAPPGWKCHRNGHFPDEDFPPGGPVVETTDHRFFAYPTTRCLACGVLYAEKQEVDRPSGLVKPDESPLVRP